MPDDTNSYTMAERRAYKPEPCPSCGSANVHQHWIRVPVLAGGEDEYTPGRIDCLNRDCPSRGQ